MLRLVRVELTRLRWRRAVMLLLIAAVVIPAVVAAVTLWNTRPVSDADLASAARDNASEIARCEKKPHRYGLDDADGCQAQIVGWYTGRQPLNLRDQRHENTGLGVATILAALLLLVGTTFVGHDWNTGSMSNQLLFEPRRGRIWAAKAIVVGGVSALLGAVVFSAYWLVLWAVADSRGLPAGNAELLDGLQLGWRGAVFAACAALGGYAMTMLFRSTVATLGVLLAVALAGGIVIAALGIGERWQPPVNLQAVVENGATYYVDPPQACFNGAPPPGVNCSGERHLDLAPAAGYWGVALVLAGALSLVSFRRRDVP